MNEYMEELSDDLRDMTIKFYGEESRANIAETKLEELERIFYSVKVEWDEEAQLVDDLKQELFRAKSLQEFELIVASLHTTYYNIGRPYYYGR